MDSVFDKKSLCCGCSACEAACPKGAIKLKSDSLGCLYPCIDTSLCVSCGLCKKVCAFQNGVSQKDRFEKPLSFAAISCDGANRKNASSGGIFAALANSVISNGGVVYGAAYSDDFSVYHCAAENAEELEALKCSKYVQSFLDDTFKRVKQQLDNNRQVMFSGTPCQVQGLKEFLGRDYENLFLCDIVCHGVPCPSYYKSYLEHMQKRFKSKITSINFRAKKLAGQTQDIEIEFENGKRYNEYPDVDIFRSLFAEGYLLRPSCFECRYSNTNRPGDITLGDFWGVQNHDIEFNDGKGISLVLVSSKKGKKALDNIATQIKLKETILENSLQPNLKHPTKKPSDYDEFIKYEASYGLCAAAEKFSKLSTTDKLKRKLKKLIKK